MADELKFESESAKAKAIEDFDESKGKNEDLQRIMDAKVEKAATEAAPTPPQGPAPEQKPPEAPKLSEAAPTTPPQGQQIPADPESIAKSKGYKSFAEMAKAFDEHKALVDRQQKFINEKLQPQNTSSAYDELLRKNRELETQIQSMKPQQFQSPQIQNQENKVATIKNALSDNARRRKELRIQLKNDPSLQLDNTWLEKMDTVDDEKVNLEIQLADELQNLNTQYHKNEESIQKMLKQGEAETLRNQNEQMYAQEMDEIDEFQANPKHPEFKFSEGKTALDIEGEYVNWANRIASAYYGSAVDMLKGDQEREAVKTVLNLLQNNDPQALNACQVTGQPQQPSEDVRKYLEICELLDHRDGKKKNPLTGISEQQFRIVRDNATGQFKKEPIRFPSLEDAYQHRLATDGTYEKRIKDAYTKGGKDTESAIQKRDNAAVQMPNAAGASNADVGLQMTPKQAMEKIETIDENEALRRKLNGDPSLWNELEKAMEIIGAAKIAV